MLLAVFDVVPEVLVINLFDRPRDQIVINVTDVGEGFPPRGS